MAWEKNGLKPGRIRRKVNLQKELLVLRIGSPGPHDGDLHPLFSANGASKRSRAQWATAGSVRNTVRKAKSPPVEVG
jgi:hypothetical protein